MLKVLLSRLFGRCYAAKVPSPAQWARAEAELTGLAHLTEDERRALRELALRFLACKVFSGAAGYEPDDHARLSIALQACLPILKLGLASYDSWDGVIVYPGDFVVPHADIDEAGVVHEYADDALGEAWDGGPVILSWFDDPAEYEGANVVIHEFAHKLDMLNGAADGLPPLHTGMQATVWQGAFEPAYADLCARVAMGAITALDPYASESPAEFFAVCSEVFFTEPAVLASAYPGVFGQLEAFYRQNPLKQPSTR